MGLRELIEETREVVAESRPRWPGGLAHQKTNVKGVMKVMKLRLKGLGYDHIVRMIEKGDKKGAIKELVRAIADAERQGKDAVEYRQFIKALENMG
jgi:hypothetical protein